MAEILGTDSVDREAKTIPRRAFNGPGPSLGKRLKEGKVRVSAQIVLTPDCPPETVKEFLEKGWATIANTRMGVGQGGLSAEDCDLEGTEIEHYFLGDTDAVSDGRYR